METSGLAGCDGSGKGGESANRRGESSPLLRPWLLQLVPPLRSAVTPHCPELSQAGRVGLMRGQIAREECGGES